MINIPELKQYIFDIIGAIHEVHKELGPGLNEYCYQEGLQIQLKEMGIPFLREQTFHPTYHNTPMESTYRIDFLCKGNIIVECKTVTELISVHRAQLFNYMRLQNLQRGILVNFTPKFATIERYFLDTDTKEIVGADGKVKQFL